jgi:hypothetical protein
MVLPTPPEFYLLVWLNPIRAACRCEHSEAIFAGGGHEIALLWPQ